MTMLGGPWARSFSLRSAAWALLHCDLRHNGSSRPEVLGGLVRSRMVRRLATVAAAALAPLLLATCNDLILPPPPLADSLLTVTAPESVSIAIHGSLAIRDSIDVERPSRGFLENVRLAFASLDTNIARVDTSGVIEARARGAAGIMVWVVSGSAGPQPPADTVQVRAIIGAMEPLLIRDMMTAIGDAFPCDTLVRYLDARGGTVAKALLGAPPGCRRLSKGPAVSVDSAKQVIRADSTGVDSVRVWLDTASVLRVITVLQRAAQVVVTPSPFLFRSLGEVHQFSGQGMDRRDNVIKGRAPTWRSSDAAVVSVDSLSGLATARSNGKATLTAIMDSVSVTDSVQVSQVPSQLTFIGQPNDTTTAGALISPPLQVTVHDSLGKPVTTFSGNVTVELGANATGATLGGTTAVGADSAVATFSDLKITKAGRYTLVAKVSGVGPGVSDTFHISGASDTFHIVPGAAATVSMTPNPFQFHSLGEAHQFVVTAADSFGNAISDPAATWSSTDTSVVSVNTSGLATARKNGRASLVATVDDSSGYASVQVGQVAVKLAFLIPDVWIPELPPFWFRDTPAGEPIDPEVAVQDSLGNTVTGFTGNVTLRIWSGPPGGALLGTTTVAAVNGVATFNLRINKPGSYALIATASGLTSAPSPVFRITPGPAAKLAFAVEPSNTPAGSPISPPVQVSAQDTFGNTATSFTSNVTVAIGANPSGGTLSGTTTRAAGAGIAMFSDLTIDGAGDGYTLTASATGLTGATSGAFSVMPSYPLTVNGNGTGSGTVTSNPGGINCSVSNGVASGTCSTGFTSGTAVTLTAIPSGGHSFTGWSVDCGGTGPTCTVLMTQARSVTATFAAPRYTLTVSGAGTGSGTVTSSPSGISCSISNGTLSGTCAATFTSGTGVTLTASPAGGSVFGAWSGACSGSGLSCTVNMTQDESVTATFKPTYALTVGGLGSGDGSVTSNPPGISCTIRAGNTSGTCSFPFAEGASVTLTEVTATSYDSFNNWSGACSGTGSTCTVNMTQGQSVTATLTHTYYTLTVSGGGSGSGTVTSTPSGINCSISGGSPSGTCSASFRGGTSVTLTASYSGNNLFAGWSGDCGGSSLTCTVPMTQDRRVTANFTVLYLLTVNGAGSGGGTVTSIPSGINVSFTNGQPSGTFGHYFADGTSVTLTAVPDNNSAFGSWSGCSSSNGTTCVVSMTQARNVTVSFSAYAYLEVDFGNASAVYYTNAGFSSIYWVIPDNLASYKVENPAWNRCSGDIMRFTTSLLSTAPYLYFSETNNVLVRRGLTVDSRTTSIRVQVGGTLENHSLGDLWTGTDKMSNQRLFFPDESCRTGSFTIPGTSFSTAERVQVRIGLQKLASSNTSGGIKWVRLTFVGWPIP